MKSWILEIRFDFGGQGSEAYKIFLAREKALSARIVFFFFFLLLLKIKKCFMCKTCNHNARMFWVVARVLIRHFEGLLTCCSVVARMF